MGPAEIGAFVGSFYLPWAFKWAFGPFIDVFTSARLGRRRGWVLGTQIMLIVTLLACTGLNLPAQLGLLNGVLLVHNSFGASRTWRSTRWPSTPCMATSAAWPTA